MRKIAAILFCAALLLGQFASAMPEAACVPEAATDCHADCQDMPCCVAKPVSQPEQSPATPVPANAHQQISLLIPAIVLWTLPMDEAPSVSPSNAAALTAAGAPLYERNCALLI